MATNSRIRELAREEWDLDPLVETVKVLQTQEGLDRPTNPIYIYTKSKIDMIRKEAWPFYRTSSGVCLCWDLEEPEGPKGQNEVGRPKSWAFSHEVTKANIIIRQLLDYADKHATSASF